MEVIKNEKIKRVYVDSSVVSGMFDKNDHPEKAQPFWDAVFDGRIRAVMSGLLDEELDRAPQHVRDNVRSFRDSIPKSQIERVDSTPESDTLAERYVKAGILTLNHLSDCKHVALATIACVDALVSWNTRHIVNANRIRFFNAVSIGFGCDAIRILTPNNLTLRGE
jgi:predicted nucleic acid-binding protein